MNRTTKIVVSIFILTLLIILIKVSYKSFYNEAFSSQECWEQSKEEKIEMDGIVKKKFIDSTNHNSMAVTIVSNNEIIDLHFPTNEDYVVWEKIKINSHVKKTKNSLTYYLENNSKKDTIVVKYNCDGNYK